MRFPQNVFLTGAAARLPGLAPRLHAVLQSLLPPGAPVSVRTAGDPAGDAWRGMAAFSRTDAFAEGRTEITRYMYDEHGGERVRRWWGGNWNGELPEHALIHESFIMEVE